MRLLRCGSLALILASSGLVACAAESPGGPTYTGSGSSNGGSGGSGGAGSGGDAVGGGIGVGGTGGGIGVGVGGGGGSYQNAEVYGHGPNELYKLDPLTNAITVIGPFVGCSSVIDLAINEDNEMYATSSSGLYRIDAANAACTLIQTGPYPNSLSFVPVGTLDPNVEALVGYNGADYVRIDPVTGAVTTVANGALTGGLFSSGDIVSVKGGGSYLTVAGTGCSDCLVQVDPATGAVQQHWGAVGYGQVYGLAYWGGSAYGFSNGGDLFQINFGTDTVTTTLIPFQNAPMGLQFWGAGSSTDVPIEPPD